MGPLVASTCKVAILSERDGFETKLPNDDKLRYFTLENLPKIDALEFPRVALKIGDSVLIAVPLVELRAAITALEATAL